MSVLKSLHKSQRLFRRLLFFWFFCSFIPPFSQDTQDIYLSQRDYLLKDLPKDISSDGKILFWNNYIESGKHRVYRYIPRYRSQLFWYHMGPFLGWMIFGNEDDGLFGEGPKALWQISSPVTLTKSCLWFLRNPFHNYTFYILGTASQEKESDEFILLDITPQSIRYGVYNEKAETVFSNDTHSLFLAFHAMKPFFSFRYTFQNCKKLECFCGWRERGNFGLKFVFRRNERICNAPKY